MLNKFFIIVSAIFGIFLTTNELQAVDRVLVIKSKRIMLLLKDSEIVKVYRISLGKSPVGHKTKAGDKKTPEGRYILEAKKYPSKYYKAIRISYPNDQDILQAKNLGVSPGGDIMIHGLPAEFADIGGIHRIVDWTDGCIAVTNEEMDELWELIPVGIPIDIMP